MDKRRTKQLPSGVRINGKKIQIRFIYPKDSKTYESKQLDWSPTPANIKKAGVLRQQIVDAIKYDTFSWENFFPDDDRAHVEQLGTFTDYAQSWLDSPENDWKPQTRYKFKSILNNIWMPTLHNKAIDRVTYSHLSDALTLANEQFIDKYDREVSKSLYNDWLACLRGPFDIAVRDRVITPSDNPAATFKNKKRDKIEADPFDQEEMNLIIDDIYKHEGDLWGAWFELGFYTGMRFPSEPAALTWQHIDLRKQEIKIKQIYSKHAKNGIQKTTKTGVERTIRLNTRSLHAVMTVRKITGFKDHWVFIQKDGTPITSASPQRKMWKAALKRLKIRYRSMYNMRHTYATFGLMNNANPAFMANQLGHSLEEFFKTYAVWINRVDTDTQIGFIDNAIANDKTQPVKDSPLGV